MPWPHTRDDTPRRLQEASTGDIARHTVPDTHPAPADEAQVKPSKSQRKRDALTLQALGAQLVGLSPGRLARLELPDVLREAVVAAQGMRQHGARTRQIQYIGRLMRQLDSASLRTVQEAFASRRTVTPRAPL